MKSVGRRTGSAIAVLLGALLVITGLSAPADAAVSRTLSLSASPTTSVTGGQITFTGRLTKSPKGATVKVQRKVGSSWYTGATVKTLNADGYYGAKITAPSTSGTATYRAVAGASSTLKAATSGSVNVTVLRKVTVTIKATPATIEPDEQTTLSGTVKPFVSGSVGFIQRFNGAKWIDLTTAIISKTGTFSRTFTPGATTTYRLYIPKQGQNAASFSVGSQVLVPTGPGAPVITTATVPDGFTDTPYSKQLAVTGEPGTWAVTAGALPAGLTLSTSGLISGTPTAGGDFTFTATYSQTGNLLSDSQAYSLHISVMPRITTTSLPDATGYASYSAQLVKTGLDGTWSITAGTLPAGITLNAATGLLSGKPTTLAAADFPLTFKFTETTSGLFVTKSLPLHLKAAPAPVITTSTLPDATAFQNYSTALAKTGNAGVWALTAGTLPAGLTFDTATGVISGKPTTAAGGDVSLTFTFTETESTLSVTKVLALHVAAAPDPVITKTSLPDATAFQNYSATVTKTGNDGLWSITAGTLPAGLVFDTATGVISGKPTVVAGGDFPLTFRFTETESGTFATKDLSLHVVAAPNPVITTTTLAIGLTGVPYSDVLTKTGNAGLWSITSGALPDGLLLNDATGAITGTPTVAGTFPITVKFTETESGTNASKALQIKVYSRPVVTTTGLADALNNTTYAQANPFSTTTLVESGGSGTGVWSISVGTLPTGLVLNATTGAITGKSTVNGTKTFTVKYADSITGATDTQVLSIKTVNGAAIYTGQVPDGKVGVAYSFQFAGSGGVAESWALSAGSLPPGLSIAGGGQLSGLPTVAGDYTFTVTYAMLLPLTNNTKTFTLHVAP